VRTFNLQTVLTDALQRRPDVIAARHNLESAQASVRLARANRYPDVTLGLLLAHTTRSKNPINPSPTFDAANFSLSVPLPLFNSYRGEYEAAVQTALQSETNLKSIMLKAEVDVRQSYQRYELAKARLGQYQGGGLELADKVLQAKLVSYQKGAATLLDVLSAQKADNDVHLAYISALTERAKALVALEQSAAIWDLENGQEYETKNHERPASSTAREVDGFRVSGVALSGCPQWMPEGQEPRGQVAGHIDFQPAEGDEWARYRISGKNGTGLNF
jgi:cobalt-zinc-cadmium efflux system outer membrane protein